MFKGVLYFDSTVNPSITVVSHIVVFNFNGEKIKSHSSFNSLSLWTVTMFYKGKNIFIFHIHQKYKDKSNYPKDFCILNILCVYMSVCYCGFIPNQQ